MDIALAPEVWSEVPADAQALVDQWLVAKGDHVAAGQAVARVILAKSTLDVTAPAGGAIERIRVPAGGNFPRGVPIGSLRPD